MIRQSKCFPGNSHNACPLPTISHHRANSVVSNSTRFLVCPSLNTIQGAPPRPPRRAPRAVCPSSFCPSDSAVIYALLKLPFLVVSAMRFAGYGNANTQTTRRRHRATAMYTNAMREQKLKVLHAIGRLMRGVLEHTVCCNVPQDQVCSLCMRC
jgi:hypothetical protein